MPSAECSLWNKKIRKPEILKTSIYNPTASFEISQPALESKLDATSVIKWRNLCQMRHQIKQCLYDNKTEGDSVHNKTLNHRII